jgi:hypothetical protein
MPNKRNALRRHHIPKMKFSVKNWAEYDAGLRRRGSLTLWVTPEVLGGWQAARRTTPGGQSSYSELAIETGMMLRLAFHLALRQTEGLMVSIFGLLAVPLSTPDHSTALLHGSREGHATLFPASLRCDVKTADRVGAACIQVSRINKLCERAVIGAEESSSNRHGRRRGSG